MNKGRRLKLWASLVCAALCLQTACFLATAQCTTPTDIDRQLRTVENDTSLSLDQKLIKVNILKNNFESCKFSKDSVYARLLHRIGFLQYNINNHIITPSIIENTLASIRINTSGTKNVSPQFAIKSYNNIAVIYQDAFQFTKALAYFDTIVLLNKKYPDQQKFTKDALRTQAYIYIVRGDYQKCLEACFHGIDVSRRTLDTTNLTDFYNYLSFGYDFLNQWQPAMEYADTVFAYASRIGYDDRITDAIKLKAMAFAERNNFDSAEFYFAKALQRRKQSKNKENLAGDYIDYGNFYLNKKNDYNKAVTYYNRVIELIGPTQKNSSLSQAYINIAQADFRSNQLDKSKDNYSKAIMLFNIPISPDFLQNATAANFSLVWNKQFLLVFLNNKTEILLALYKKTLDKKLLTACIKTALVTDSVITQTRHEQLGEQSKLYWRNNTTEVFSNAIEACYLADDISNAFRFLEKSRAVLLFDKINELTAVSRLSSDEASKEENYQIKLIEQQQKLSALQPASPEYNLKQTIFYQTKDSFEHYILSLENKHPLYYQYKYADDVSTLQSLQQYLAKNNQSFVYYFMNDSAIYALAITQNKTSFIKIPASEFDDKKVSQFINLCSNKKELMNHYPDFAFLSQSIYNKIFKPLQIPKGNVAICTDNFFIPFEALCSDDKGKHFLLNDYNFNYVYSARSLMKTFTTKPANGNFIGFAPVSFSSTLQIPNLTQSASALENTARWYSNKTLFINEQATRDNFLKQALNYSVLTIFSHAKADTSDAEPMLYMQDSVIRLSDLQRLNNPSIQFVLLSACQTNIGKNATGEGIYSLARGFASVGVPSVCATLWKADEAAVYQISDYFNQYLATGMNKNEALQKAKIEYLKNCDHEHTLPFYWANMVLVGSSQPLVLSSSNHWWVWVCGTTVFFFALACIVWYKIKNQKKKAFLVHLGQKNPTNISI